MARILLLEKIENVLVKCPKASENFGSLKSPGALIGQNGPTGKFFSEETNPKTGEIPW
jgi:hypothetical protein